MEYNENSHISHLRQPSRILSPGKLAELSASANNVRTPSMLPPPPGTLKRKTLAERAGETSRPAPGPPGTRPVNATVRPTSIAGISRQNSFSSSVSTRPQSSSSIRNVSNSSYSSSVGSTTRPPSAQSHRPQNALSSHMANKAPPISRRPVSSFDTHPAPSTILQTDGNRKSMTPLSSNLKGCPIVSIHSKMPRGSYDNQMNYVSDWSSSAAGLASQSRSVKCTREVSLSTALQGLTLSPRDSEDAPPKNVEAPCTPSHIPKRTFSIALPAENPSPSKSPKKARPIIPFLTRDSNTKAIAWNTEDRLENMEYLYSELREKMDGTTTESNGLKETVAIYKTRIIELETIRGQLAENNAALQRGLDDTKASLSSSSIALEDAKRHHNIESEDLRRQHHREVEEINRNAQDEAYRLIRQHRDEIAQLRRQLEDTIEVEKTRHHKEVQALTTEGSLSQQRVTVELDMKEKTLCEVQDNLEKARIDLLRERDLNNDLRAKLSDAASSASSLEASMRSLRARIDFLESDCKSQSQAFADLEQKTQDAIKRAEEANDKLRIEESLRRKLHNQVQELKGNIRVFCRVRPLLDSDIVNDHARITFPDDRTDSKEVEVLGPEEKSSLGNITTKKNSFKFDRVFTPVSKNADVFGEISQLIQSALDGYNVCIFCYGQTGAGKTYTMSSDDGMIPRAVRQIYDTAQSLEEKGWRYAMEGSFVEVYNENLNDLLGKPDEFDKKKHEIRHDMQKCKTTITDITSVNLDSPSKVENILRRATANRSVAATQANERSSRSHSVFILKLIGHNSITGEKSEGTLNLVDLAGSERLSHSGSTGERLKETQNINKSLSCLGDVIGALGQGKKDGHVPYRNSKLTYLLQFSLGGNSKTLMLVMISPLQAHLSETLTSLKFATKVHNTHIGTAKRQAKIRDT